MLSNDLLGTMAIIVIVFILSFILLCIGHELLIIYRFNEKGLTTPTAKAVGFLCT